MQNLTLLSLPAAVDTWQGVQRIVARLVVVSALVAFAACSSGPPRHEARRFPLLTFDKGYEVVKGSCREALRSNRFPVRETTDTGMSTGPMRGNGFTWTLTVSLVRGEDHVSVDPVLAIDRHRAIRPVRRLLSNTGEVLEEADANRRDRFGGEPGRSTSESPEQARERAIREVEDRVYAFLQDLEGRLGDRDPE